MTWPFDAGYHALLNRISALRSWLLTTIYKFSFGSVSRHNMISAHQGLCHTDHVIWITSCQYMGHVVLTVVCVLTAC